MTFKFPPLFIIYIIIFKVNITFSGIAEPCFSEADAFGLYEVRRWSNELQIKTYNYNIDNNNNHCYINFN